MTDRPDAMTAEFLRYNRWANLRLIDACLNLATEQLASSAPGVYGSIYATLVHIIQAEARYCRRLTGLRLDPPFAWEAAPSLSEMRPYAEQVGSALVEAAETMQITDSFQRDWEDPEWEGRPTRYKSMSMLIQAINHGVEHRTNITTILAQQGIQTPDLDGWEYMRVNPDRMGASSEPHSS
jgi:uncharacterized damage-inducible protein DinB